MGYKQGRYRFIQMQAGYRETGKDGQTERPKIHARGGLADNGTDDHGPPRHTRTRNS